MSERGKTVPSAPSVWLQIRTGERQGTVVKVSAARFVIGREDDCDLVLPDPKVSRHHAAINLQGPRPVLEDLESVNGTFLDGRKVQPPPGFSASMRRGLAELRGEEVLQIGDTFITTSLVPPEAKKSRDKPS